MEVKKLSFFTLTVCFLGLLFPGVCRAATYYVATKGDDANNGTNIAAPLKTLTAGINRLAGGDKLMIRAGTYTEVLHGIPSGAIAAPTIISGYSGETVIINGVNSGYVGYFENSQYIVLENLVIDGAGATNNTISLDWNTRNITLRRMEIRNAARNAIFVRGDYHTIQNVHIHHFGQGPLDHGIYIKGSNNVFENCQIHNGSGLGIHIYASSPDPKPDGNIVRRLIIYNQTGTNDSDRARASGIGVFAATNTFVYNNIVYGSTKGITVGYSASNSKIYNNTIFANTNYGIYLNSANTANDAVEYEKTPASDTVIRNNIIYQNGIALSNAGIRTVSDHNLTVNPLFVNIASSPYNFHLQAGSPAVNAGMTLPEVATDFDGHGRPYGSGYDIGAYEYGFSVSGTPMPTSTPTPTETPTSTPGKTGDVNRDGVVNMIDIGIIVDAYGVTPVVGLADLSHNGVVNMVDIGIVIDNYRT